MIQFAGIAVLVVMLMVGLIITVASIIGYFICCKRETQYKLGNKIILRTSFIIGISITSFPVMFFYMIISNNRKQDEQALIREQQEMEEANAYDENNNIVEVFLEKDNMTGFRLIVTDSAAGSKYYELEKTIDGGSSFSKIELPMELVKILPETAIEKGYILSDYDYYEMPSMEHGELEMNVVVDSSETKGITFVSDDDGESWRLSEK